MKKESAAGLYKQIWIIGYDNTLCPNTTVNEAHTQEIQTKIQERGNYRTRTASQKGCISASDNRESFRKTEARVARPANVLKIKPRGVNKGT